MKIQKANEQDLSEILALQKLAYQENAVRYNDFDIPPFYLFNEARVNTPTLASVLSPEGRGVQGLPCG